MHELIRFLPGHVKARKRRRDGEVETRPSAAFAESFCSRDLRLDGSCSEFGLIRGRSCPGIGCLLNRGFAISRCQTKADKTIRLKRMGSG